MDSFVGTKVYAAPEILRHRPYDASVDEYSTGVLVALLLTGKHPLSDIEVDTNLALASCDVCRSLAPEAIAKLATEHMREVHIAAGEDVFRGRVRDDELAVLVSGAVAGFAGGIELLTTTTGKLTVQISNGYGFAGIIVAALALMRPSGVAAVALAFGALQVGGQAIQTNPGVSPADATILQGLVLFGAIGAAVFSTYRLRLVDRQVAES